MARLPSWRQELPQSYVGARKWGTGINPVHAKHWDSTLGRERQTHDPLPSNEYHGLTDTYMVGWDEYEVNEPPMEQMDELNRHPSWEEQSPRSDTPGYPSWGMGADALPKGTALRARKWAMPWREGHVNAQVAGEAGDGWRNKEFNPVYNPARVSDPSQYEVQTSMRQLDLSKVNDAAVLRGTDDPRSPIASRVIGMKEKVWPGGIRHEDMFPRQHEAPHRPFRYRTAGVGPWQQSGWNDVNEMYVSEPIQRTLPPDVNMGSTETAYTGLADYDSEDFYYG